MKKEFVRNPYNYDSDELSDETGLKCFDESLTEQEHLQESDINYIAERFMKTGQMPQIVNMPTYEDFNGIFDFQSAMNLIVDAKHEFMRMPAKLRSRFNNDPAELIAFLEDPANKDEAIRLGLIERKPEPSDDLKTGPDQPAAGTAEKGKEPGKARPKGPQDAPERD